MSHSAAIAWFKEASEREVFLLARIMGSAYEGVPLAELASGDVECDLARSCDLITLVKVGLAEITADRRVLSASGAAFLFQACLRRRHLEVWQ